MFLLGIPSLSSSPPSVCDQTFANKGPVCFPVASEPQTRTTDPLVHSFLCPSPSLTLFPHRWCRSRVAALRQRPAQRCAPSRRGEARGGGLLQKGTALYELIRGLGAFLLSFSLSLSFFFLFLFPMSLSLSLHHCLLPFLPFFLHFFFLSLSSLLPFLPSLTLSLLFSLLSPFFPPPPSPFSLSLSLPSLSSLSQEH